GGDVCAVRLRPRPAPCARVLVAHGAGNDAVYPLLELFRALLRNGHEVFSFDLDGHGCGSTTVFAPDTVRTCVAAAAEQAERGGPELPLHLIGHSLGGSLVLDALASGALDRAVSATILSAPVDVRIGARTAITEVRGFFTRATLTQREHYGLWGLVPAFGPVKRAAYPFRRTDADRRAWSYVAAVRRLLADMDLERRVESIRVPTLLVYSYADALVPAGQGLGLSGRMMRAGGNFRGLTRATHYSLPFDPDTLSTVTGWLHAMHPAGEAV
ncbi:MAG TPA: alpha/beta fold hydrolase, partial [Longimicrobium sp.]|nr:alpha/beta fold hydrolase [Longimicrobium sp.]